MLPNIPEDRRFHLPGGSLQSCVGIPGLFPAIYASYASHPTFNYYNNIKRSALRVHIKMK
jgi:hypothetical protein